MLCTLTGSLVAQSPVIGSPIITNFYRSDYRAETQNWAIVQDGRGIMYFGNNKGLIEFDGTNWQLYQLPNRTIVRSIDYSSDEKIYVGGQSEFGYFASDNNGKNQYHSLSHLIPSEYKSFEDIWKVFRQEESVFFCSEKAVFKLINETIEVITPERGRFENFFHSRGELIIQVLDEGLFTWQGDRLLPIPFSKQHIESRVVAFLSDSADKDIIITAANGLFIRDETGIRPWKTETSNFLATNLAYCAVQLSNGNYAIGTSQNGLIVINPEGQLQLHLNKDNGLQNNTILSICQDIQQNLWLGLDNGIDYAEIYSPITVIQSKEGIEGTGYASIIKGNKLYLGTNQGLYSFDWRSNLQASKSGSLKPVQEAVGQVWNINDFQSATILSQHNGASYIRGNAIIPFSDIQGSWKFTRLVSNPGYAIEGTYSGIHLYKEVISKGANNSDNSIWEYSNKIDGFDESARIFEQDDDGYIWVSHAYKGLYKIELSEDPGRIKRLTSYDTSYGLPVNLFIDVAKIRDEVIFTTPQGVYQYDSKNDRFNPHENFVNIFGENRDVHRLIEDELGNVWFSIDSEFGVLKVKEKGVFNKLEISYFNQIHEDLVDGFQHVYAHDDKHIFIGTKKGFLHYNPSQPKNIEFPFRILIRQVTLTTKGDSIVSYGTTIDGGSDANDVFKPRMNDFRFSFSAPYYEKINHLYYRYKLEGFQNEWSAWSPKTEKEYTNLNYGDYSFMVQARNAYGKISSEDIYSFSISPPWHATIWAKITYFLLPLLFLTLLINLISKREKKKADSDKIEQRRKFELKEAEFKKEVEKSEVEVNKLNNEKLLADINHKNSQLASTTMHLVQKSEILMKIKNDLNSLVKDLPSENKKKLKEISRTIEYDIQQDDNWNQFELYFDQVHENFFKNLRKKHPELSPKDQKLCAYLRMNLSTKEIAPLLNISVRGVEISRYRLRKKLSLDSNTNLVAFITDI